MGMPLPGCSFSTFNIVASLGNVPYLESNSNNATPICRALEVASMRSDFFRDRMIIGDVNPRTSTIRTDRIPIPKIQSLHSCERSAASDGGGGGAFGGGWGVWWRLGQCFAHRGGFGYSITA